LCVLDSAVGNRELGDQSLIAISGISSLFFAGGLVLGIKGLRRMKVEGRKGITGRALTGVVLNGLLFCLMIFLTGVGVFVVQVTAKQKEQEASAAQKRKEMVALRDSLTAEFGLKVKELVRKYQSTGTALINLPVLDMAPVKSREELKVREKMIGEFIAASKALQDLTEHGTELYQQELLKHKLPRTLREASVKIFAESFSAASNPQNIPRRQAEVRRGEAMLKVVTILDGAWGQWELLPATQKLEFKHPTQAAEYNAAVKEFSQANEESLRLQRQSSEKGIGQ